MTCSRRRLGAKKTNVAAHGPNFWSHIVALAEKGHAIRTTRSFESYRSKSSLHVTGRFNIIIQNLEKWKSLNDDLKMVRKYITCRQAGQLPEGAWRCYYEFKLIRQERGPKIVCTSNDTQTSWFVFISIIMKKIRISPSIWMISCLWT